MNLFINLTNRGKKKKKLLKNPHIYKKNPQNIDLINWNEQFKLCFCLDRPLKLVKILYM